MKSQFDGLFNRKLIPLYFGTGLLVFVIGFGVGNWFGSEDPNAELSALYAQFKDEKQETVKIYGRDVLPQIADQLRGLEREKYRLKRQFVEDFIFESNAQIPATEEPSFSDAELKDFATARGLVFSKLNPKQRRDLEGNFRILKTQEQRRQKHQARLAKEDLIWSIPATYHRPKVEVGSGTFPPIPLGRGKGTIVVFANYHCPSCSAVWAKLDNLAKPESSQGAMLRVRYKVNQGDAAIVRQSVLGGFCAHDQGKFAEYHKAVVEAPPQELSDLHRILEGLNIKLDVFDTCLKTRETDAKLTRDLREASLIKIAGQAIAVVNGTPIEAEEPLAEYLVLLGN